MPGIVCLCLKRHLNQPMGFFVEERVRLRLATQGDDQGES